MRALWSRRRLLGAAGAAIAGGVMVGTASPAEATAAIGTISMPRIWGSHSLRRRNPVNGRWIYYKVPRVKNLYEGTHKHILNRGSVSHWTGTAPPQSNGNCVLFGHRTAAGGPLRNQHKFRVGDPITITIGETSLTYYVKEAPFVVSKNDFASVSIWGDGVKPALTIVSCSKRNKYPTSTAYRLIVRAEANVPT